MLRSRNLSALSVVLAPLISVVIGEYHGGMYVAHQTAIRLADLARVPGSKISKLEYAFAGAVRLHGRIPMTEYWAGGSEGQLAFARPRRWRLDFAWPDERIAVEIMGGIHGMGRPCKACGQRRGGAHVRGVGYERDARKLNAAVSLGWIVTYFTEKMIRDPAELDLLAETFERVWSI